MKRIILSILTLVVALTTTAQGLPTKAIIVHKSDGQQDTLIWKDVRDTQSFFYGKENPEDGDYIELLNFKIKGSILSYDWIVKVSGGDFYGYSVVLSSQHINSIPENINPSFKANSLYFADKEQWFLGEGLNPANFYCSDFGLVPGQTYYLRAYYLLDGKAYSSHELSQRYDKTLAAVYNYYYADYVKVNENVVYKIDADALFSQHANLLGEQSDYVLSIVQQHVSSLLAAKEMEELSQIASKTEACDDGTLYVIDNVPEAVLNEALQNIVVEASQSLYVQANLDNIYSGGISVQRDFMTSDCVPTIIQTGEEWGIRDNQYLFTKPKGTFSKPVITFTWEQLMQPGKTYDVTLTLAPDTEDETDSLDVWFNVTIGSKTADGNTPTLAQGQVFGTDTVYGKRNLYIAHPKEMKVMTMQYQPANLSQIHYLQLGNNPFSFTTSANRRKHGREFRIVGFEVTPRED